jgi:hypothetical protein
MLGNKTELLTSESQGFEIRTYGKRARDRGERITKKGDDLMGEDKMAIINEAAE